MDLNIVLGYTNRYLANQKRLMYTILPSSRKKVKTNIKLAEKRIDRYVGKDKILIPHIRKWLVAKLEANLDSFDNKGVQEFKSIVTELNERKMPRQRYYDLSHQSRYDKWVIDSIFERKTEELEKGLASK